MGEQNPSGQEVHGIRTGCIDGGFATHQCHVHGVLIRAVEESIRGAGLDACVAAYVSDDELHHCIPELTEAQLGP
jgi:hypothetical protein